MNAFSYFRKPNANSVRKNICNFFLAFYFLFTAHAAAQKIEWSNGVNDDSKYDYVKITGADEAGFFVLKSNLPLDYRKDHYGFRKRKYAIAYFDFNMRLKMQKDLVPTQKDMHIFKILFAQEKILIISTLLDKESKAFNFYAQWLNNKGVSEQGMIKIDAFSYANKTDLDDAEIIISKDQKSLCILQPHYTGETSDKQMINAITIDSTLKVAWKKQIVIPFSRNDYENHSAVISDDGSLFVLGHTKTAVNDKTVVGPRYSIFSYNLYKNIQVETPVPLNEFITDAGLTVDNKNKKIIVAGFYGDKTIPVLAGVFSTSLDINSETVSPVKTYAFESKIMDSGINVNSSQNSSSNYPITRLVTRNDGGVLLLSEASYMSQNSYYDYFTRSFVNRIVYHFDNILMISINADGSIDWQQNIPKAQETQDDGGYYSSFCALIYPNKINIVYNNSIEKNNTIYTTSVSNKGLKEQKVLLSEAERVLLIPQGALQIDNTTLIVPAYRDRKFVYAKIKF